MNINVLKNHFATNYSATKKKLYYHFDINHEREYSVTSLLPKKRIEFLVS